MVEFDFAKIGKICLTILTDANTCSKMSSLGFFVRLIIYFHGCLASPTVCDVILASKMITNTTFCHDNFPQPVSLCDDNYFVSTLFSCNVHGEIQMIDLSGFDISGKTIRGE